MKEHSSSLHSFTRTCCVIEILLDSSAYYVSGPLRFFLSFKSGRVAGACIVSKHHREKQWSQLKANVLTHSPRFLSASSLLPLIPTLQWEVLDGNALNDFPWRRFLSEAVIAPWNISFPVICQLQIRKLQFAYTAPTIPFSWFLSRACVGCRPFIVPFSSSSLWAHEKEIFEFA